MTFEWFPIALPHNFELVESDGIGVASRSVQVSRNSDLHLEVSSDADGDVQEEEAVTPGKQNLGTSLRLSTYEGVIEGYRRLAERTESRRGIRRSFVSGEADSISLIFRRDNDFPVVSLTEWLTNVPVRLWGRSSKRVKTVTTSRLRDEVLKNEQTETRTSSRDYLQINLNLPSLEKILIGTVPLEFVSEGSELERPGFIKYFRGPDGLPDEHLRNAVVRAFEFLLGNGLGVLGHCEFDVEERPVRVTYRSAYVPGGMGPGHRPALLDDKLRYDGLDETIITKIVRNYIQKEQSFGFNGAVWLFLHGKNAPLEMAAGYVGAAFEILRRGYYSQPENEARSKLIPTEKWRLVQTRMKQALSSSKEDVLLQEFSSEIDEVEKRFAEFNKVSGKKLTRLFLTDLRLRFGATEERGLNARDIAAHALSLPVSQSFERLRSYRAIQTLFARVFLRLLDAPVCYFDYSALNHPPRCLEDAQGNPGEIASGSNL